MKMMKNYFDDLVQFAVFKTLIILMVVLATSPVALADNIYGSGGIEMGQNNVIRPDMVRFEMRMVQGQDPRVRERKKPGGFGRFLSGLGKVLGAIAMPMSFIFPPAAIGAAGMYGVGALGDGMQRRAYAKASEQQMKNRMTQVSFPGLGVSPAGGIVPASGTESANDQRVMQVLNARGNSMTDMSGRL